MDVTKIDAGKLLLSRLPQERAPLLDRLSKIEGQVRGLKAMIEADRYCGDELQQIKAAIAGLRQVAMILSSQHIAAAAGYLVDKDVTEIAHNDIMRVLGEALKI